MTAHDIIQSLLFGIQDTEYMALQTYPRVPGSITNSAEGTNNLTGATNDIDEPNRTLPLSRNAKKKIRRKANRAAAANATNQQGPHGDIASENGESKPEKLIVDIADEEGVEILCPLLSHLFQLFKRLYTSNLGMNFAWSSLLILVRYLVPNFFIGQRQCTDDSSAPTTLVNESRSPRFNGGSRNRQLTLRDRVNMPFGTQATHRKCPVIFGACANANPRSNTEANSAERSNF